MVKKKQKEKVYFTIKWHKSYQTRVTKAVLKKFGLFLLGLLLIVAIGVGSGGFKFVYGVARCGGLPAETSHFFVKTVTMPGEKGYGPSFLSTYEYCTREQAQAAGFGPVILSEEQKRQAKAEHLAREEAKRFSPEKVDYQVYIPVLEGYSVDELRLSEIKGNQHTFMRIKKNGTVIGSIRELQYDDSYNICVKEENPNESYCQLIGNDAHGREIKRYFHHGLKDWQSWYVGVNIDNTGIILTSDNDTEAIQLLSSLQKYSKELVK